MHPPLGALKYGPCAEVVAALEDCHRERSIAKFVGVCNKFKTALDNCLTEEVNEIPTQPSLSNTKEEKPFL